MTVVVFSGSGKLVVMRADTPCMTHVDGDPKDLRVAQAFRPAAAGLKPRATVLKT
jgi:hypothetical protein